MSIADSKSLDFVNLKLVMSSEEPSEAFQLQKEASEFRDELTEVASDLDKHMKNVNIARITGGSFGVAGGVTAAIGFGLIPVTMGLSALIAGIVGASIAAAGGLTAGGATLTKVFIDKRKLKPLIDRWAEFQLRTITEFERQEPELLKKMMEELSIKLDKVSEDGVKAAATAAGVSATRTGAVGATTVGGLAARTARATVEGGLAAGSSAARVAVAATAGSVILNVALIGLSLYDIIDGAIELHRQKKSKAGDVLRSLAASLDDLANYGLNKDTVLKALSQMSEKQGSNPVQN